MRAPARPQLPVLMRERSLQGLELASVGISDCKLSHDQVVADAAHQERIRFDPDLVHGPPQLVAHSAARSESGTEDAPG